MRSDPADDYDFYPCLVDGAPASIYVNLRFDGAPIADATTRYEVLIRLREGGAHGIGREDEAAELGHVEEAIIERADAHGLVYVGRLRHRGVWETTFYGPAGHEDEIRAAAEAHVEAARVRVTSEADAEWTYYRELLLPDAERRQWMNDRRMVDVLKEQGDVLRARRRVDHELTFTTDAQRDRFVTAVASEGFTVERLAEADGAFVVTVSRADPIELEHIHDVVMVLVDAASARGGTYAGWKTSIESGS